MPAVTNRELALAAIAINMGARPLLGDKNAGREFQRQIEEMLRGEEPSEKITTADVEKIIERKQADKDVATRVLARLNAAAERERSPTPPAPPPSASA